MIKFIESIEIDSVKDGIYIIIYWISKTIPRQFTLSIQVVKYYLIFFTTKSLILAQDER